MNQPPFFYLLGDPSFGDRGKNIHPLLSLVSDQLFTPCFLPLPRDTPSFMLHVYIDDITTSATLSDTLPLMMLSSSSSRFCRISFKKGHCIICLSTWLLGRSTRFDSSSSPEPPRVLLVQVFQALLFYFVLCWGAGRLAVQHHAHSPGQVLHHPVDPVEGWPRFMLHVDDITTSATLSDTPQ